MTIYNCACSELGSFAVVGMGAHDGLDERIFDTLERNRDHGGEQWWLYASSCTTCGRHWMVAQDERIHDNYCLKRLSEGEFRAIVDQGEWPVDFLLFENVLRAERDADRIATFLSVRDSPLAETVKELQTARPDITVEDVAYVLAIPTYDASRLMKA